MFFICIPKFLISSSNSHAQEGSTVLIMMFDTSFSFKVSFVINSIHLTGESPKIPIHKRLMSHVKSFEMYKAEKGSQWKGKVSRKITGDTCKKEELTISIGLMGWNEKETKIKVNRGKRISCVVVNDDTKVAILRKLEVSALSEQFSYDAENEANCPPIKKGRTDNMQMCSETKEICFVAETNEAFT